MSSGDLKDGKLWVVVIVKHGQWVKYKGCSPQLTEQDYLLLSVP